MASFYDLKNKVYFLTKTNSVSFTDANMVTLMNNANERVSSLIMQADARWQFDDTNQSDLPIATTALVADQADYTFAVTHLSISRVEVKDEQGNWNLLQPIDQADIYNQSLTDFMSGSGVPKYYDKIGNSLFLYPKASYAQNASLKVWFKRPPVAITTTSISASPATEKPGFNALYHDLIAYIVAHDYAMANGLPNANQIAEEVKKKETALQEDYALRSKDEHVSLRARQSLSGRGFFR